MSGESKTQNSQRSSSWQFFRGLALAFGGAILFSFPMLMTMEMWWLGFYMSGTRLAIFTLLSIPLLVGLSHYDGFEDTSTLLDDVVDMFVVYAVGFTASALLLLLFGVLKPSMSVGEIIGKISIQTVVAGIGAMLTQSLLVIDKQTEDKAEERKRSASYGGQLFLMLVGAIFLSMSVAPTEEMILISYQISYWHVFALAVVTILIKYAFVYAAKHQEKDEIHSHEESHLSLFLRFSVVGYAIALLVSFYILWTFGSIDDVGFDMKLKATVVLAFPAAIGAAASRLIL